MAARQERRACRASCGTDAALGDLPLVYPFLVNDPGEGTQAKRRAHATIVDHLMPPMARAETYGDIARLEQLLDEHANIAAMDPAKLPAIRAQIWTLMQAAQLDHDLGLADRPDDDEFDEFLLHVDGWLCEIKDVQIRDGLHVLGAAPTGEARVDLVLAILRARQMWGGEVSAARACARRSGSSEDAPEAEPSTPSRRGRARWSRRWRPPAGTRAATAVARRPRRPTSSGVLRVRRHRGGAPAGGHDRRDRRACCTPSTAASCPAGPVGLAAARAGQRAARPAATSTPSTRRRCPSRLAWETGQAMAESLRRALPRRAPASYPRRVGLSVWGTSAMRTSGDDIAEVLALLGVRPVWDEASPPGHRARGRSRSTSSAARASTSPCGSRGFFRDAFPHVRGDARRRRAAGRGPGRARRAELRARARAADLTARRRAPRDDPDLRLQAGHLRRRAPAARSSRGNWRDDADLAEVYTAWGGYAYGRGLDGVPARGDMEAAYRRIAVAAKNTDTREHDIADSDDYFQYHGGMVATVRALTGTAPAAYVGDSTRPEAVRTRTLHEETARVFRARVVNPRWIDAMRRHGYKGAFELAATVDYLFGYDATTGVVADWMYEKLTAEYVLDPENRKFLEESNPWALHGMSRAAARGRRPRAVGAPRRRPRWTRCGRRTWRPRASWRGESTRAHRPGDRHRRGRSRTPHAAGRGGDRPRRGVLRDRQGRCPTWPGCAPRCWPATPAPTTGS